ncbi:ATP-binding cassette domain-containing protein [Oscillibacter sp. MSJ-2]|uniref:ATP-binding cassette domain-containing protein n=1 Tax=Dysosmobacter acutus TaxID=2841504 RepID=A0ABS6F870_9FIRM|nr:oligopeptide/dipeptide ABC transporter ATP-binding protein [Dysosmobacter acutus]MBU5626492.1 ATP-binding cassette domain-containing protein [Dysosmobacter acutus]
MEREVLLRGEGLVKEFPAGRNKVHAVSDVDITIYKGETLGLVGESGCGKSTLGRLILGLLRPTAGKLWFEEKELTAMSTGEFRKMRKDIQCIFQDPYASLDPRLSIANSIMEPLTINGVGSKQDRQKQVEELLRIVGIPVEYKNRFPHQFSGGQRQRVGIARALALNPKLIVCDEPVSALDVSIQAQVLNLLADLQEKMGLTYLFISHDLNVVRRISDRVCIMYLGMICESGPTEEIFAHPRHPYTSFLLSAVPVTDPSDRQGKQLISGELPSPMAPPPGCRFHTRCPYATEECRQNVPAAVEGNGRLVACHHPR